MRSSDPHGVAGAVPPSQARTLPHGQTTFGARPTLLGSLGG